MALDTRKQELTTIGNYELCSKIAEGGMATVYKARDKSSGQTVAIKVVPPQVAKNPVLMKRFEQEYAVANALNHPNIVRAVDFCGEGSNPFLVMEFVDGESVGQRIEREGRIPEAEALFIIGQVAQALHKAHKLGLIHRDIKPDNILVTADGKAKVADLGLVKELETDLNLTRTGRGLGTPHFMAPEQFRNAKNADARCDIYSLAATLYNMVTGELPFKSSGPLDAWMKKINNDLVPARELVPTLSERVDWALGRAMSVDKEQRPTSCREFVEDLTGHSTRKITASTEIEVKDVWYLYYTDDEEVTRTVKGTLQGIRRSLREGVLGDAANVRASRSKSGPFEALRKHPEFRDIVLTLENGQATRPPSSPEVPMVTKVTPREPSPAGIKSPQEIVIAPPACPNTSPVTSSKFEGAPHIRLGTTSYVPEWLTWAAFLFSALCLAAAGYFVLPLLSR